MDTTMGEKTHAAAVAIAVRRDRHRMRLR